MPLGRLRGRASSGARSSSVSLSESLGGTSPVANTFFLHCGQTRLFFSSHGSIHWDAIRHCLSQSESLSIMDY